MSLGVTVGVSGVTVGVSLGVTVGVPGVTVGVPVGVSEGVSEGVPDVACVGVFVSGALVVLSPQETSNAQDIAIDAAMSSAIMRLVIFVSSKN